MALSYTNMNQPKVCLHHFLLNFPPTPPTLLGCHRALALGSLCQDFESIRRVWVCPKQFYSFFQYLFFLFF